MFAIFSLGFSQLMIRRSPPLPLRSGHIYMKDAQRAETNEKTKNNQKRPKKVVLEKGPYVHEKHAQCAEANVVN